MNPARILRVLVVEADPLVGNSIWRKLQFERHEMEVARNGAEALALLRNGRFDLMITDHVMPGMKGDKLAALINSFFPDLPILLVAASGEHLHSISNPLTGEAISKPRSSRGEEAQSACISEPSPVGYTFERGSGVSGILRKPFQVGDLCQAIAALVAQAPSSPGVVPSRESSDPIVEI